MRTYACNTHGGYREKETGVTRMRISADPCGTICKRNADLRIAKCIDEVRYGGCWIPYRLFIVSRFTLDSIYLCCCSWVPIKVGIKDATRVTTLYNLLFKIFFCF